MLFFNESDRDNIWCEIHHCRRGIANAKVRGDRATLAYFIEHLGRKRVELGQWLAWKRTQSRDATA